MEPKACTILLRGPSKDTLNEVERSLPRRGDPRPARGTGEWFRLARVLHSCLVRTAVGFFLSSKSACVKTLFAFPLIIIIIVTVLHQSWVNTSRAVTFGPSHLH